MSAQSDLRLWLINDRRERELRVAQLIRQAELARHPDRGLVRRTIGRRLVSIGEWFAADAFASDGGR
jgi:hypothetical protein